MTNRQEFVWQNETVSQAPQSPPALISEPGCWARRSCISHTGSRICPKETECYNVNAKLPFRRGNGAALQRERTAVDWDSARLWNRLHQWPRLKKKMITPLVLSVIAARGPAGAWYLRMPRPRAKSIRGRRFREYSNIAEPRSEWCNKPRSEREKYAAGSQRREEDKYFFLTRRPIASWPPRRPRQTALRGWTHRRVGQGCAWDGLDGCFTPVSISYCGVHYKCTKDTGPRIWGCFALHSPVRLTLTSSSEARV